jgi:putative effector of murein hydrolase LrgA (UPF0299 family)
MLLPVMVVTIVIGTVVAMGVVGYLIDKSADEKRD